jgi:hypothetical protein
LGEKNYLWKNISQYKALGPAKVKALKAKEVVKTHGEIDLQSFQRLNFMQEYED